MSKAICACTILLIQIGRVEKLMRAENGGDEKQVINLEWPNCKLPMTEEEGSTIRDIHHNRHI